MTRTEALPILAEKVMNQPATDHGGQIWIYPPRALGYRFNPWTKTLQALDLAEAWCKQQRPTAGYYVHTAIYDGHVVQLYQSPGLPTKVGETSEKQFAAALTGAVCEAERIEVKDE